MSERDGGPAYPVSTRADEEHPTDRYGHQDGPSTWQFPGMTLRDRFAIAAVAGVLADLNYDAPNEDIARSCYELADAMLAERERDR